MRARADDREARRQHRRVRDDAAGVGRRRRSRRPRRSATPTARAVERLALPAGVVPGPRRSARRPRVDRARRPRRGRAVSRRLRRTAAPSRKRRARSRCSLAADLGQTFAMGRIAPADYRKNALALLAELPHYQCADGGFGYWPGGCMLGNGYLTAYVLHVMKTSSGLGAPVGREGRSATRSTFSTASMKAPTPRPMPVQMVPVWGAANAFGVKVLTEYGRNEDSNITRLMGVADRLPVFALSYLADAIGAAKDRGPRYQRCSCDASRTRCASKATRRTSKNSTTTRSRGSGTPTSARRPLVLEGFVRRGDDPVFVRAPRALAARRARQRPLAQHAGQRQRARSARRLLQEVRGRRRRT